MFTRRKILAASVAAGALLATGPVMAQGKGLIGISMPTKSSTRWISDGESMVKEFTALGYESDLQYGEDDIPNQLAQIENMVTKGAKVLIIAAIDGSTLSDILKKAHEAGAKVFAYDRLITKTADVDYYTTFDNFGVGVLQGTSLVKGLKERFAGVKPWNVELFGGSPDDTNAFYFYDGAMSVLQPLIDAGDIAIVSGQMGMDKVGTLRWDGAVAQARMDNLLSAFYTDKKVTITRWLELRYRGVEASLTVPCPIGQTADACAEVFADEHRKCYGYVHEGRELEIVAARIEARGGSSPLAASERVAPRTPTAARRTSTYFGGRLLETNVFERGQLQPGDRISGPAIVCEKASTAVIDPDWEAEVLSGGELLVTETAAQQASVVSSEVSSEDDPVLLEIFNSQFAAIAEQMGITLRNTSSSVNVKERLDFSCALFTPEGDLVVNAPHIPVHLGAMAETVRRIIRDNSTIRAGDVFATNDPYRGGSHLPDVTVVTPVHGESGRILFFTASRAHHAELGGIRPGSMPPFSKNLAEEGVLIRNFKLVDAGTARWDELRALLLAPPYPTRDVEANLADIAAQVAANRRGALDLLRLVERYSLEVVESFMRHIQSAAERKVRRALAKLADGSYPFADRLDDGTPIRVTITIRGDSATVDFSGSGPVSEGNLNANPAIVTAAVMYVLRAMLAEDIPLNQGVLAPVEIIIPPGILNPPASARAEESPAVVGGNVETSQRIVDVLLGALGLAAASQGTMNNLLFGDATFGYYETICGGAGATPRSDGADAVHTHMTNTRLTDPEVMERRYPVRVQSFSIRRGSGGDGRQRGGDGVIRRLEFLQPLEVSLLTERRGPAAPYGLAGGQAGALGRNTLERADGSVEKLGGKAQFSVEAGDVLMIETPGGGGFGAATADRPQSIGSGTTTDGSDAG